MEVVIVDDEAGAGELAGMAIAQRIKVQPDTVLGLATGSSPLPIYQYLIAQVESGELDFSAVHAFMLDEYVGLPYDHPELYRSFIEREFTRTVGIVSQRLHSPNVYSRDIVSACADYEQKIRSLGGISIQILGIGIDGHIGFNEPISSLASRTRLKTLTEQTRSANARFFNNEVDAVPRHVVTQGVGTILDAEHLIMIASGAAKAKAVAASIEGAVSAVVPASALQLHPHVTFIVDTAAAAELKFKEYYRHTYNQKPHWQSI